MAQTALHTKDEETLCIATTALRDLYLDWPQKEIAALDGNMGLEALVLGLVTEMRGRGINDEGSWNTDVTADIPVADRSDDQTSDSASLEIATTALCDLYMGYKPDDIIGLDGSSGLNNLICGLVTDLRGRGLDDEGGWDCDATVGIPVAQVSIFGPGMPG